jgi:hypothetical protein
MSSEVSEVILYIPAAGGGGDKYLFHFYPHKSSRVKGRACVWAME